MADEPSSHQQQDKLDSNNTPSNLATSESPPVQNDDKEDGQTTPTADEKRKESEDEGGEVTPPPEGGWGWVIVGGIFLMFTVLFGYIFALAVLFVEWMRYFDASATDISWVVSLAPAVSGLMSKLIISKSS